MKYRLWNGGTETVYACGPIERSFYTPGEYDPVTDRNRRGNFTFLTCSGGRTYTYPAPADWSYGSFHGLTVSLDGTKFFLQDWENGVRCFDMTSGKPVWKNRIRHTRNLLVSENTLTAVTGDRKLVAMSVKTGKVTAERTGFRRVIDVTESLCMAEDREKQCFLVDKDTLETRLALPGQLCGCTIDILPAGNRLYALTETLSDTVPRREEYRLEELALPEKADPALWASVFTGRRLHILREAYGLPVDDIIQKAREYLFRIEYAIAEPEVQLAGRGLTDVDGLFRIRAGKREYGIWYKTADDGVPHESLLCRWMEDLERTLPLLLPGGTAYVREIEEPYTWLRFRCVVSRYGGDWQIAMNVVHTAEILPENDVLQTLPEPLKEEWETDVMIPRQFYEAEIREARDRLREEILRYRPDLRENPAGGRLKTLLEDRNG